MYYINYSCLNKMINDTYTFIIILKRIILLSRKIVILDIKKGEGCIGDKSSNFLVF